MSKINLLQDKYDIKNEAGEVLTSVSLLDLYYTIAVFVEEHKSSSKRDKFIYAANCVNEEYGSNFSWGEVINLFEQIDDIVEESKKNSTLMQE